MESVLLATKLQIPPETRQTVQRNRLLDLLEPGVTQHKLTVLAAPAGYGKTTLLAQWARAAGLPVAWLSLDAQDNDPERFLRYLLTAWDARQPGVRNSRPGMLLGGRLPDIDAALAEFINALAGAPEPLAFVFDDYHLIEEPAIHQALTFPLDHLPSRIHFIIAGRKEPPLPLARYRARQELLEFGPSDLQFLPEEATAFLRQVMALDISAETAAGLQADLEGWAAGLQLAALTLRNRTHGNRSPEISGKHRFIADYLSAEVLALLPDDVRQFLLQTSILDRLCGPLCDAVTGRQDSQQMLEMLERENLFLVPLDDNRQWFRYHNIFSEYLQETLKRQGQKQTGQLHSRAARWYFAHDMPDPAFDHAREAGEVRLVVEIVDHYANAKLLTGELRLIKRWADSLAQEWYRAFPILGLLRAGYKAYTGDFSGCLRVVDEIERELAPRQDDDARRQKARVNVIRCYMACIANQTDKAETLADRALRELPADDLGYRPGVYAALGDTYRQNGRWEDARQCYLKALEFSRSPAVRVQAAHHYGALADLELLQGHLRQAAAYWQKAQTAIHDPENWGRIERPLIGWVDIRMSGLLYEQNQLAEAREHLARGLERAELTGDVRAMIAGYLLAGHLAVAEGNIEAANDRLYQTKLLVENAQFPDWTSRFERFQLELWLEQGQLSAAERRAEAILSDAASAGRPTGEPARLAAARVLLAGSDTGSVSRALALLEQLLRAAEAAGRDGVVIEALALQALGRWRRGEPAAAMTRMERALRLAEPEGYVRLFVDLGLPMARLLQEARARSVMPDYVSRLLSAFAPESAPANGGRPALAEPLTTREQEVLELLAAGLTNREIAGKLVISAETVKKHTGSIYGKLGASSRMQAVAAARTLKLLN